MSNLIHHPIILFDGVCNFCDGTVQWLLRRDKKGVFRFAALQSETGQQLLKQFQLPTQQFDSFILIESGQVFQKSSAALRVLRTLGGVWGLLWYFHAFPLWIRDTLYNFVARNRYKFFGKKETCMLPSREVRARFLN